MTMLLPDALVKLIEKLVVLLHEPASPGVVGAGGQTATDQVGPGDDPVRVDEAMKGARRGVLFHAGIEDATAGNLGKDLAEVGVFGACQLGHFDEGGNGAEAAGIVVEGGKTDAVIGKPELFEEPMIGGGIAIDDGSVELTAEVGSEPLTQGRLGLHSLQDGGDC
jgi:hypothetical protein